MNRFKKYVVSLLLLVFSGSLLAQDIHQVEMADGFYKEGKIYIVIVVLSIVLVGILVYLFSMDRKLKKLEDQIRNKN